MFCIIFRYSILENEMVEKQSISLSFRFDSVLFLPHCALEGNYNLQTAIMLMFLSLSVNRSSKET